MARCIPPLESSVTRTKILVGILAVALPFAAVAGCGAEKKRTIKAEIRSAADSLQTSKSASMTFRIKDEQGNVAKTADDDDIPKEIVKTMLASSISFTIDPVGKQVLQDLEVQHLSVDELKAALKDVNLSLLVRSDQADISELRLIDGTLFAHINLKEINRLAVLAGEDPIDDALDEAFGGEPELAKGLADVRAGKWLKLPIGDYIQRFKDLAQSFSTGEEPTPTTTTGPDYFALGEKLFTAAKPYIKVTDANDSTAERVLDVKVQARPALKAMLAVLKAAKDLPMADDLRDVVPSDIDENVKDGFAKGTITLKDSHFSQLSIDMESVRLLDPTDKGPTVSGGHVIVDVDDSADEVTAPTDVSSFDIGEILESVLSEFEGEQAA